MVLLFLLIDCGQIVIIVYRRNYIILNVNQKMFMICSIPQFYYSIFYLLLTRIMYDTSGR